LPHRVMKSPNNLISLFPSRNVFQPEQLPVFFWESH